MPKYKLPINLGDRVDIISLDNVYYLYYSDGNFCISNKFPTVSMFAKINESYSKYWEVRGDFTTESYGWADGDKKEKQTCLYKFLEGLFTTFSHKDIVLLYKKNLPYWDRGCYIITSEDNCECATCPCCGGKLPIKGIQFSSRQINKE